MNIKQLVIVVMATVGAGLASGGVASAKTCTTSDLDIAYTVTNRCGGGWFYFRDGTQDAHHAVEVDLVDVTQDQTFYYQAKILGINSSGNPITGCSATDTDEGVNGWVSDFTGCGNAVEWRGVVNFEVIG